MDRTPTTFDVGITTPIGVDIPLPFEEAWARDIIVVKQKDSTLKSTQPVVNFPGKTFRRRGKIVRVMDTNDKELFRMPYDLLKPTSDRHVSGKVAPGLTPKQLAALNLEDGKTNVIKFKVYERRGTRVESSVECNVFLWNWDTKVVVTDVDGTITTSNCGNKLRKGVVRGFSVIEDRGYKIIYLSARPYSRLSSTRELLKTKQDGESLPEGPVIHASDGYIPAIYRYFFRWHGTHFKQPYLEKVKSLFEGEQPFFAGFGDTTTDAESYEEVGIEDIKVFHLVEEGIQIKPDGKVEVTYHNGYESLVKFVNEKFPRLGTQKSAATSQEDSHNPGDDQQIPLRSKPGKQSQILPL